MNASNERVSNPRRFRARSGYRAFAVSERCDYGFGFHDPFRVEITASIVRIRNTDSRGFSYKSIGSEMASMTSKILHLGNGTSNGGRLWAICGQLWAIVGDLWAIVGDLWTIVGDCGQLWAICRRLWSICGRFVGNCG
jgi:hypothetical protein